MLKRTRPGSKKRGPELERVPKRSVDCCVTEIYFLVECCVKLNPWLPCSKAGANGEVGL